jgi:hypothetical protein
LVQYQEACRANPQGTRGEWIRTKITENRINFAPDGNAYQQTKAARREPCSTGVHSKQKRHGASRAVLACIANKSGTARAVQYWRA